MSLAKRSVLISALVTSLGTWVFWWGTDGFTAFTAETARRVEILRSPRALPDVTLEDQNGNKMVMNDSGIEITCSKYFIVKFHNWYF